MRIETNDNQIILKEVYNSIVLETREGKKLHICMRDSGYDIKLDSGDWHMIEKESDFKIVNKKSINIVTENSTCPDMRDGSYTC